MVIPVFPGVAETRQIHLAGKDSRKKKLPPDGGSFSSNLVLIKRSNVLRAEYTSNSDNHNQ